MYIDDLSVKAVLATSTIGLFCFANMANAAVVLSNETRSVSANASISTPTGFDSVSTSRNSLGDFADFDQTVAVDLSLDDASASSSAEQVSQISSTSISGSGAAAATAEVTAVDPLFFTSASSGAGSNFSVSFEAITPQFFDLSGVVTTSLFSGFTFGNSNVTLRSLDGFFSLSFTAPFIDGVTPFDISGTLFPNTYILSANSSISASAFGIGVESGAADFAFDFNVSEVPVPAAAWLFGSGLLCLIGFARKKAA